MICLIYYCGDRVTFAITVTNFGQQQLPCGCDLGEFAELGFLGTVITTQWVQSKASEAQLEDVTDALLLAMHDLRTVLVRKKADRLIRAREAEAG
ncbi:MAG: hypothetical protein P8J00_13925 [Yoonia sp.]|nr:hypothetical protein [Yoonia sp.]